MSRPFMWPGAVLAIAVVWGLDARAQTAATPPQATVIAAARAVIAKARYATFTTLDERGAPLSRIVDPFEPDAELTIWIGTNSRTRKVEQIARDGRVTLTYFDREAQHYVTIVGTATVVRDLAARTAHFKNEWKAFYPKGPQGDDYVVVRVDPQRLEVVAPSLGINNDPITWRPVTVEMPQRR